MPLLDTIHSPADVRKLSLEELPRLSAEIRELLVQVVARNGGHLSSNLGAVDLTLALHRVIRRAPRQDHLGHRPPELHPQDHHRPPGAHLFHPQEGRAARLPRPR